MPKRKPGRKRKDELSAAESIRLPPEEIMNEAKELLAVTEKDKDSLEPHPEFEGVSKKMGHRINMITIMRVHGYWDKEIADELGVPNQEINRLEQLYPAAFNKAEATALSTAMHKIEVNCLRVRAAAAKRSGDMLNLLADMSEDTDIPPHIRYKCIISFLNLMGMNMPIARGGTDDKLNKGVQNAIIQHFHGKEQDSIDVVDAEVVND